MHVKTVRFTFLFLLIISFNRGEAQVIPELKKWLALDYSQRPAFAEQKFARKPVTRKVAEEAKALLFEDRKSYLKKAWQAEWTNKEFNLDNYSFKFDYHKFGDKPAEGRSLYISLHGGGGTTKAVNDQQWRNQLRLYTPAEGIYVAPRAPTDSWNMWHQDHIDFFLDRLIQAAIVFEEVNPDKVYIMGYSAGGDGVFQLAPRMADRWAAAAMMAGHPGDASALNLRNIGFTIHMGGDDAAYKRNELATKWGSLLDSLQSADPAGYKHEVKVHTGLPHWMNRLDTVAVSWMAQNKRNPWPAKIIWQQDDVRHNQFYWLGVPATSNQERQELIVTYTGNEFNIIKSINDTLFIKVNDEMMNLNKKITVRLHNEKIFSGKIKRSLLPIWRSIEMRTDKQAAFYSEIIIKGREVSLFNPVHR